MQYGRPDRHFQRVHQGRLVRENRRAMISSPPKLPVDVMRLPGGDVLLLPALWPVRLTPEQRVQFALALLGEEYADPAGC